MIVSSCSFFSKKEQDMNELATKFSEKLNSWNLNNVTTLRKSEQGLTVEILFKGVNKNAFFLDKESNNMILTMLGYSFYENIKSNDTVKFQLEFEGYPDMFNIALSQDKLLENYQYFISIPRFYEFVEHSFVNLGYLDVMRSTQLIKYLNENYSEIFNYNGSFWNLLYDYSRACEAPNDNLKSIFHFILFSSLTKDPDNPRDDDINQDAFKFYLSKCGFPDKLLQQSTFEIMDYLDKNYNK
jgi:hypothetical protein